MKNIAIIAALVVVAAVIMVFNLNTDTSAKNVSAIDDTVKETLTITGSAYKKVMPDKVSFSVGVTTTNSTAEVAAEENAKIMNKIIDTLNENGISNDEISTGYYNVYPIYSQAEVCIQIYPPPAECNIIIGFRVENTLTITTDASKDIGQLIDLAINAGATNIYGANYFISRELFEDVKDKLIEEAVINAKKRAELALKPLNMTIVGVANINVYDTYMPPPIYYSSVRASGALAETTPIITTQEEVQVNVNITFYIS